MTTIYIDAKVCSSLKIIVVNICFSIAAFKKQQKPKLKSILNYIGNIIGRNRTIFENFSYLSAIQIFNILLPLITYPYLIRVLGKETYGLVIFAQAIVAYLVILVGFGFNISATKAISIHRDNKLKLNEIVSSVFIIKGLLFILSSIIMIVFLSIMPEADGYELLFLISLWACIYDIIFPIWYFQGIERMKYITYISLISRTLFLILIFFFIHAPEDYLKVPILYAFGALISGCVSLFIIFKKQFIRFEWQSYTTLKFYFLDSLPIFVSNVSVSLYVSTNKVITGAFLGMSEVAYYDLAEKLTNILKIPQSLISQTLFPKISKEKNLSFIKQVFNISVGFNIFIFLISLIFSEAIILFLGGQQMIAAKPVFHILALTVPIISMSNIFGIQILIPFGYSRLFSRVILISGFIYLLMILLLWISNGFSIISISIVTVIIEMYVTIYMFHLCKKFRLW